jgi:hypothetical protein
MIAHFGDPLAVLHFDDEPAFENLGQADELALQRRHRVLMANLGPVEAPQRTQTAAVARQADEHRVMPFEQRVLLWRADDSLLHVRLLGAGAIGLAERLELAEDLPPRVVAGQRHQHQRDDRLVVSIECNDSSLLPDLRNSESIVRSSSMKSRPKNE